MVGTPGVVTTGAGRRRATSWSPEGAPAVAAVVLAMTISWATLMVKFVLTHGRKKPYAWRWLISQR